MDMTRFERLRRRNCRRIVNSLSCSFASPTPTFFVAILRESHSTINPIVSDPYLGPLLHASLESNVEKFYNLNTRGARVCQFWGGTWLSPPAAISSLLSFAKSHDQLFIMTWLGRHKPSPCHSWGTYDSLPFRSPRKLKLLTVSRRDPTYSDIILGSAPNTLSTHQY